MSKELHYFDVPALAEHIRYILSYTKQEFKDVRYDYSTWPDQKIKDSLPYGQFPLYKEGDRVLTQSFAIARYVSTGTELMPTDPWEQALADSIVGTILDYWGNVRGIIIEKDPKKRADMKKKLIEEKIDYYFSRFEKKLKDNGGYFLGKLSWADFVLCGFVEASNVFMDIQVDNNYPAVKAIKEKIKNSPGVKEHIAARGPYNIPKF